MKLKHAAAVDGGQMTSAGLATVLAAAFIGQVDLFIVTVAAPSIQRDLDANFQQLQFVMSAYVVVYAAGLVIGGRAGDRFGRLRVFATGVAAFAIASCLCALAPNAALLIAARAFQGAGAATMAPQVLAIVHASVPSGPQRARAVVAYGACIGLGVVAGLVGGGVLVGSDVAGVGWRAAFLVNLPICTLVLLGCRRFVPPSRAPDPRRLDVAGSILIVLALPALLVPAGVGGSLGWPAWTWTTLVAGVAMVVALVAHGRRKHRAGEDPVIAPRLFTLPGFGQSMVLVILFFAGNAGLFLVLTYHLQLALQLGPLGTGLVFTPLGIGFSVGSTAMRGHLARFGLRLAKVGAGLMAVSSAAIVVVTDAPVDVQPCLLATTLGVSGIGQGLVVAPLIDTVLSLVPEGESGAASGIYNTLTQAGMATGIVVLGAVYSGVLGASPQIASAPLASDRSPAALEISALILVGIALLVRALAARVDATVGSVSSHRRGADTQP